MPPLIITQRTTPTWGLSSAQSDQRQAVATANVIEAAVDPTVNDDSGDGIPIGMRWHNDTTSSVWECFDATLGAAVWIELTGGGGGGGLGDPGANGVVVRTALNTTTARTITGDATIVVTNGDGVAGNPSLTVGAIPQSNVTDLDADLAAIIADLANKVDDTRNVNTNSPLTGGGPLSSDLTLDFDETVPLGNNARVAIEKAGVAVGTRRTLNFIEGSNVTLTLADDAGNEEVDITISAAAGGAGNTGSTTVNFGAFPGSSDASVTVTGQASIVAGSVVEAWIELTATADHTADEHWIETIDVWAGNIVAGVGFTIYARNTNQVGEPSHTTDANDLYRTATQLAGGGVRAQGQNPPPINVGGASPRLYGQFTVRWRWA